MTAGLAVGRLAEHPQVRAPAGHVGWDGGHGEGGLGWALNPASFPDCLRERSEVIGWGF